MLRYRKREIALAIASSTLAGYVDAIGFLNAFLANPGIVGSEEMRRIDALPVGAARSRV